MGRKAKTVLLPTGDKVLAEAAPNDCIWGIGLSAKDARVQDPSQWQGRNELGIALMRAREHLRGDGDCSSVPAAKTFDGDSPKADAQVTPAHDVSRVAPPTTLEAVPIEVTDAASGNVALGDSSSQLAPHDAFVCPTQAGNSSATEMPVMSDSEGEPLLLYRDETTGATRLSVVAAPLRLIFLDVDGVLNNESYTQSCYDSEGSTIGDLLVPECLTCLQAALDQTQAHVVLSSTWRSSSDLRQVIGQILEQMRPGCVVGQTPQDPSYRNDLRPAEIASFLADPCVAHAMGSKDGCWCAVDDMNLVRQAEALSKDGCKFSKRLLPSLRSCFVRTAKEVGLDELGSQHICSVLERKLDIDEEGMHSESASVQSKERRRSKQGKKWLKGAEAE